MGCAGYVVQVAQAMWWPVQTNNIARLGLSQVSQSEPSVAIFLRIKLMGPEEIHIYFLEGAPRPQKENMIDPKTWKFFLVNFQILGGGKNYYILGP